MQEAVEHTQRFAVAPVINESLVTQQRIDLQRIREQLQAEIARRESLETQLLQMQAMRAFDLWAGSLAHEIKNPLTSIRAFVQLVSHKRYDSRFVKKFERIVLQELDRIDLLVNQLLQLTKPLQLQPAWVPIRSVLHRVIEVYSEPLHLHDIALHTDFTASLPFLEVDGEQFYRACANIILNAIEAMPVGGALHIICRPLLERQAGSTTEGVEVIFRDTGVGIASDQLPTLFTPFQTTKPKGTGLGLPMTRKIIEAHGGQIHLSSAVGRGTVVTVVLPALPARHTPTT